MLPIILSLAKKQAVLVISLAAAVVTMFFVPPDASYIAYVDVRVLCLLFCLMAVVAGFQACGVFGLVTDKLLQKVTNGHLLGLLLVLLPFLISMLITNDVALLLFVPFTMGLLRQIGCTGKMIPVLVLQTVAANLGSMATPFGNPQNLFLYAHYELSVFDFFSTVLPLTCISFAFLGAASLFVLPGKLSLISGSAVSRLQTKQFLGFGLLFLGSLCSVFRILDYRLMTVIVCITALLLNAKAVQSVDYALLFTFVCFFIVSGNLGRIDSIRSFLGALLEKNTLLTSVATSQIISNVPAAVLLSSFTEAWKPLLQGVNIGGLGTPIASLASIITIKLYLAEDENKPLQFLGCFTVVNLLGLLILLLSTLLG